MLGDPLAGLERVRARIDRHNDARAFERDPRSVDELYAIDPDWLQHLHEALGWSWPCEEVERARESRADVMTMFTAKGLPERYAGWCDGGHAFTEAAWCLTRHLSPEIVVETGVARGVTSRLILEAMEGTGGHLWSIDLPSVESRFHPQIGIAVPERLAEGWTLLTGSSRRRLPGLLHELGRVDLFIHDSVHTGRNTLFEIDSAWNVLRPGGALLVDDVYQSLAFEQFRRRARPGWTCVGAEPDGSYRFGIAVKS